MIKAVIFDIDGVLIDSFEANFKFFQDLMIVAGYKPPVKKEYSNYFHLPMWDVIKTLTESSSDEEIKRIWNMGKNDEVKYPHDLLVMPENAEEIIKKLRKKYLLGIVTSRVMEGVDRVPVLFNLKKYFNVMITYQDTKNHKPHPEPILLACEKLDVIPNEAVYVGDVENDVIAGKAAGTKTILFSKKNVGTADLYTSSFLGLPKLISLL